MTIKGKMFGLFGGLVFSILLSIGLFSYQSLKVSHIKMEESLLEDVKVSLQNELLTLCKISNNPYSQSVTSYYDSVEATYQSFSKLSSITLLPSISPSVREALETIGTLRQISQEKQSTLEDLLTRFDRLIGKTGIDINYFTCLPSILKISVKGRYRILNS